MTLTPQQAEGIEKVKAWYGQSRDSEPGPYPYSGPFAPFRWFGYAGTGKTFTAAQIPEALGLQRVVFGTYTGKAASVLRRSLARYGLSTPVTTIHSAIYRPTASAEARRALWDARRELAELREASRTSAHPPEVDILECHIAGLEARIPALEADARRVSFQLNPDSEWANADLIILDEVSMVNAKLAADIESFGVPVLVLGDPAQLPPVEGGGYYIDAAPDHMLTVIQRQALDNPIVSVATRIRESDGPDLGLTRGDMRKASMDEAEQADIVLTWTNERRWAMVDALRKRLWRPAGVPEAGDKVMVLTNNSEAGVFNGEIFTVRYPLDSGALGPRLAVEDDRGIQRELDTFWAGFRGQEEQEIAKRSGSGATGQRVLATFAQAITVHKSQGSEWRRVYVVNETSKMISSQTRRVGQRKALEQARQWLYTAATRAKDELTITYPR